MRNTLIQKGFLALCLIIFTVASSAISAFGDSPPVVTISSPTSGYIYTNTPQLSFTATSGTAAVTLDGAIINTASGNLLGPLADGQHTLQVTATDSLGNVGSAQVVFTVDIAPPTVSITSPSPPYTGRNPILQYSANYGTVVVKLDNVVVQKTSGDDLGPLPVGPHILRVEATDGLGRVGSAQVFFNADYPQQVGINTASVSTAENTFVVTAYGDLWAWGPNDQGYLGDGTTNAAYLPEVIQPGVKWSYVAAGEYQSFGIKTDGSLWEWGINGYGELGKDWYSATPVSLGDASGMIKIVAGNFINFGVKSDGSLWGWGGGYLGNGTAWPNITLYPTQVSSDYDWTDKISVGGDIWSFTLAIKADGSLWSWGENDYGKLGNGTIGPASLSPVQIGGDKWRSVSAGWTHALAIKADGTLWGWGSSPANGTNATIPFPVPISAGDTWVAASAGLEFSVGIKSDGSLWGWGSNMNATLGVSALPNSPDPVRIGVDNDWVAVWAGSDHVVAQKINGTLWAWGQNGYGQVGDGSSTTRYMPVQITGNAITLVGNPGPSSPATLVFQVVDPLGVTQMQFSNDNQNWSSPEPFSGTKQWQLSSSGTVYARFMNSAGIWSDVFSASIPPQVAITSPADGTVLFQNSVNLVYTATAGAVTVTVDGIPVAQRTGDTIGPLHPGYHSIRVVATNEGATGYAETSFAVLSAPPLTITPIAATTSGDLTIKPTAGGSRGLSFTVSSTTNSPINYQMVVSSSDGTSLRTISGSCGIGVPCGINYMWDGTDDNGKMLEPGSYSITLNANDSDGNSVSTAASATVSSPETTDWSNFNDSSYPTDVNPPENVCQLPPMDPTDQTNTTTTFSSRASSDPSPGGNPFLAAQGNPDLGHLPPGEDPTVATDQNAENLINDVFNETEQESGNMLNLGSTADFANGNLSHGQNLFASYGGPLPITMGLYYNSLDPSNGSLGWGWSHSYDISLKVYKDGSVLLKKGKWRRTLYAFANAAFISPPGDNSTLAKNADGSFTLNMQKGVKYQFTSDGRLTTIVDRNGNAMTFGYTGGNLTTITAPTGQFATIKYDAANRMASVTDPGGNSYYFSYNGSMLSSVQYPDGGAWQYNYDAQAFMLSKTDPLGNTTSYGYDSNRRVASSVDPNGRFRTMSYASPGPDGIKISTFTEKDGGVWQFAHSTQTGSLKWKVDPLGGTKTFTYDNNGRRTSVTNPLGAVTSYTYDNLGNISTKTDSLGNITAYTYDSFGQVASVKDSLGNVTLYAHDAGGNLTGITKPSGAATQLQYDSKGRVSKVTNPLGKSTVFGYDTIGNLTSITDPAGAVASFTYDASGNVISRTDAAGNTSHFAYDARNRLLKITDPLGNITTNTYDLAGNRTSQTDANGHTTFFEYNFEGKVTKTKDAAGAVTTFAYGSTGCSSCGGVGKLTAITDANGNTTSYTYNTLGKLLNVLTPLGGMTSYVHDAAGRVTSKTDANGTTTNYSYDNLGRLLKKTYPDNTALTFTYDSTGRMLSATNLNISYTLNYDADGRLTKIVDSSGRAINYGFDLAGNRTSMSSSVGIASSYAYDVDNRLTAITLGGATFKMGYDIRGERTSLIYPNGDTVGYTYDADGRLKSAVHKNGSGTVIASNTYALDPVGLRISNTSLDRTISYEYDPVYRILEAISSTPGNSSNSNGKGGGVSNATQQQKEWYSYDLIGNRISSDQIKSYTYNQENELTQDGTSFIYDNNGNLTETASPTGNAVYTWDYDNRLLKIVTPAVAVDFKYDPFGRRLEKKVTQNGTATITGYFYDRGNILFEYDANNNIGNIYTQGPRADEHFALANGKNSYYYHTDGLGSVINLTDTIGKVVQSYDYDSFGNLKDQQNKVKQPFAFTGREWDRETELYYYRARYYAPIEGRFISKDPIGFRGSDITLYGYVHSNPSNSRDSRGLWDDLPNPDSDPDSYNPMDAGQAWAAEQNANAAAARAQASTYCNNAKQAMSNTLNSQLGQIDEAYPPGTTTGHPVTDTALAGYSIFKWIWNGIFN